MQRDTKMKRKPNKRNKNCEYYKGCILPVKKSLAWGNAEGHKNEEKMTTVWWHYAHGLWDAFQVKNSRAEDLQHKTTGTYDPTVL